ncbi:MAG: branched-chain alpha-keto acid dehydrogenase subunit E2 [Marivirga sp.]|nr:branched-chain alpha-keto acid dehydrogenase subunit E2 [Marivirga sp.]
MESGFLREWSIKTGDPIKRGDIIAEVETQKGIIDIEVFDEGIAGELLIKVDEKVPVGTVMMYILSPEEAKAGVRPQPVSDGKAKVVTEIHSLQEKTVNVPEVHHIRASPLARKIAEKKGIDLSKVKGTGPDGAITRTDVENEAQTAVQRPTESKVTDNIRMAVAAAMSKSNREVPHYYLQTKVDMSHSLEWLANANKERTVRDRLLPVVLLIKAVAKALADVPDLNAWWDNGLQRKQDIHIGFVVSLRDGGIIVPAIHDAGKKSLDELMRTLSDVIPRARALKLRSSELADSTITITSLGEGAVETVYGVIYPPQVALVGFGAITEEPWAENGMLGVKPVLTVSLAADHRATDGNTGSEFLTAMKSYLKKPEHL